MISFLVGKPIIEKEFVTILTGGVGYAVRINEQVLSRLRSTEVAELFIYTHVRENAIELYGFSSTQERDLFLLLLDVSGVGPKTALGIINLPSQKIISAIQNAETAVFSSVPRVGKKLAQKIIIELRSKLGALKELDLSPVSPKYHEVMEALQGLGFPDQSIEAALKTIDLENLPLSQAVKLAIQLCSNRDVS